MQKHGGRHQSQQQQRATARAGRPLRRAAFCGSSCDDKDTPLTPIHLQPGCAAGGSILRSSLNILTFLHLRRLRASPTSCQLHDCALMCLEILSSCPRKCRQGWHSHIPTPGTTGGIGIGNVSCMCEQVRSSWPPFITVGKPFALQLKASNSTQHVLDLGVRLGDTAGFMVAGKFITPWKQSGLPFHLVLA